MSHAICMKRLPLSAFLLAVVLASCATRPVFAQEAKAAAKPKPAAVDPAKPAPAEKPPELALTDLQKAKLDAASQRFWRVQDRANELLGEFGKICLEARKENKWPPVRCNPDDLSVVLDKQVLDKPATPPKTDPEPAK